MTETSTTTPTDVYFGTVKEPQTEVRQPELEAPLTKRQLKHRRNKDSKLTKKFVSLDAENGNLKSQMEALEDNQSIQEH